MANRKGSYVDYKKGAAKPWLVKDGKSDKVIASYDTKSHASAMSLNLNAEEVPGDPNMPKGIFSGGERAAYKGKKEGKARADADENEAHRREVMKKEGRG